MTRANIRLAFLDGKDIHFFEASYHKRLHVLQSCEQRRCFFDNSSCFHCKMAVTKSRGIWSSHRQIIAWSPESAPSTYLANLINLSRTLETGSIQRSQGDAPLSQSLTRTRHTNEYYTVLIHIMQKRSDITCAQNSTRAHQFDKLG